MNILVVAAHPDDEVLGCGGTIARLSSEGHAVHILILGEGLTSRGADPATVEVLRTCSRAACSSLGAADVWFARFPDNRFDSVSLLDIVKTVEEHVGRIRPEVVFTQHGGDLNIDHERTFRAVLTATRPMEGGCVHRLLAYEVGSSTEWSFQRFSPVFRPGVFVDIGATLERKIAAMEMYKSERRPFPHPRSPEALRASALRWGSVAGLPAAEAFELVFDIQR